MSKMYCQHCNKEKIKNRSVICAKCSYKYRNKNRIISDSAKKSMSESRKKELEIIKKPTLAREGKLQYATNGYGEHRINFNKDDKKLIGESRVTMFVDFKLFNKIIEFDGGYWHKDDKEDNIRDQILRNRNYEVLRIKEKDYKNQPKLEVEKCLKFLNLL